MSNQNSPIISENASDSNFKYPSGKFQIGFVNEREYFGSIGDQIEIFNVMRAAMSGQT